MNFTRKIKMYMIEREREREREPMSRVYDPESNGPIGSAGAEEGAEMRLLKKEAGYRESGVVASS